MVGYRQIPTSDPEEQRLRDLWHSAPDGEARRLAGEALSKYLWSRVSALVEADRAKHPKALRNQPVPTSGPSGGRYLP